MSNYQKIASVEFQLLQILEDIYPDLPSTSLAHYVERLLLPQLYDVNTYALLVRLGEVLSSQQEAQAPEKCENPPVTQPQT